MHYNVSWFIIILGILVFGNPGCSRSRLVPPQTENASSQTPSEKTESGGSEIRSVDFANFTYPWVSTLGNPKMSFALQQGRYEGGRGTLPTGLIGITYGDLTNDNSEEAIVILDVTVKGGSASPNIVYLYSKVDGEAPRLLWAFSTGDRKDGGLRRVYSDKGKLVVELYGKNKIIGTDLYSDDGTQAETPFPYYYTRVRYVWSGSAFQRIDPVENISDPKNYGIPIMPTTSSIK